MYGINIFNTYIQIHKYIDMNVIYIYIHLNYIWSVKTFSPNIIELHIFRGIMIK